MAVLSLPLTFQNSFWSQDYRKGLEVLYTQLENGVLENEEIVAFIRARAAAESALAATLSSAAPAGKAFAHDDGASLHVAFRGLKEESKAQGRAHEAIAMELREAIAGPFKKWAIGYRERLIASKHNTLDGYMLSYELSQQEVTKLKNDYLNKTRKADEAEDDARFAPISQPAGDKYTTSPNLGPRDRRVPVRQPTMSERITARFKELRMGSSGSTHDDDAKPEVQFDADAEEKEKSTPKLDKGKGRAVDVVASPAQVASPDHLASPPPLSPPLPPAKLATNPVPPAPAPPIIVAGLSLTPTELSALLNRAKAELPLRPVRFPLLGEYQECFSGEEFATWLRENVKDFEGSLDRAEDMAKELTEKMNLLRRRGELGNDYENADDAFYQFRPKAFNLDAPTAAKPEQAISPVQKSFSPLAENVAKRTTTFASLVSKALNANGTEPAHIRARRDAEVADKEYRVAVRKLDRQRLGLEERIEETLKTLQKWEVDRLRAVKTVLRQYQDSVAKFSKAYEPSLERSATLIASYQPEADIKVFIERHRTGPFRPEPQVYESVTHDESDVVFGIDLRRWADSDLWHPSSPDEKKDEVPPVLTIMLAALSETYARLPTDIEKRKTWIYDVPLPAVHHLRETLNAVPPEQPFPNDILAKYDVPVLASAVKLWTLELDPPLAMYEGWDELRKLYPTVGSGASGEEPPSEDQHIQDLQAALQKLPKVHLLVLDTIVRHLKGLIDTTPGAESEESNAVYITKLALTMGRTILRPKQENEFSIQDRHPTLLFIDLLNKYDAILPPTITKKKRESERKVPIRRRTRPIDMRMSRSRISAGADLKEIHAQQLVQRGVKISRSPPPVPNVPLTLVPESPRPVAEGPDPTSTSAPSVVLSAEPGELPAVSAATSSSDAPVKDDRSFPEVPPPPPIHTPTPQIPSVPPPPPIETSEMPPAHPVFKEPPPEIDDLPPRPTFKEPPPEPEDSPVSAPVSSFAAPAPEPASPNPPMPSFKEPPPETEGVSSPTSLPTAIPSVLRSSNSRPASPRIPSGSSRSPSPTKPVASPITPTTSDGSRLRGPRLARGPRPVGGGAVSSMVNNLNRQSIGSRPASPGLNGGATGLHRAGSRTIGGHGKRSSISRVSEFSRRTMASDAEDEVVEK
ncbi:hypothetical protein AcV5_009263 [Taiwanofungus camphoratus]|nr:hypothetical protein AcV5_009263 [Antrodia cinnamomea]KAI0924592.1 hypothetical protein AcW2_005438 [Antrodia cinnamomea]